MDETHKAVLEGGPKDLPQRVVPAPRAGDEVKIPFRGGYEHFSATARHRYTDEGDLPVYEWTSRTEMAS
ncbi:DUF5988 family protein [Nocardiopsis sp. NPDC050513]|uniref:DUF5988 family protein n=1 Tax=Nocardiopsis sp. NPDC050513 TaxID=3364338 RepID=UPI003787C271